jgi:hypothetical protein
VVTAPLPTRRAAAAGIIGQAEAMSRLIVVGGVVAALVVATTGSASAATDEDQVRAVLDGMNSSYNRSDFETFASHVCANMLKGAGFEAGWYASRQSDGPTQITINSVDVTGVDAVANVRFVAENHADAKTLDIEFLREGAEWKACRYNPGQYI